MSASLRHWHAPETAKVQRGISKTWHAGLSADCGRWKALVQCLYGLLNNSRRAAMTPDDRKTPETPKKEPILMNWLIVVAAVAGACFAALAFTDM